MPSEDYSKQHKEEDAQGFSWQLKLLVTVMILGVMGLLLKFIGVF